MHDRIDDMLRRNHQGVVLDVVLALLFLLAAAVTTFAMSGAVRTLLVPAGHASAAAGPGLAAPTPRC